MWSPDYYQPSVDTLRVYGLRVGRRLEETYTMFLSQFRPDISRIVYPSSQADASPALFFDAPIFFGVDNYSMKQRFIRAGFQKHVYLEALSVPEDISLLIMRNDQLSDSRRRTYFESLRPQGFLLTNDNCGTAEQAAAQSDILRYIGRIHRTNVDATSPVEWIRDDPPLPRWREREVAYVAGSAFIKDDYGLIMRGPTTVNGAWELPKYPSDTFVFQRL